MGYAYTQMHIHAYAHIHTYTHTHIHTYTRTQIHIHIYTCTHTHIHIRIQSKGRSIWQRGCWLPYRTCSLTIECVLYTHTHTEQGPFYLVKGLLNALSEYPWGSQASLVTCYTQVFTNVCVYVYTHLRIYVYSHIRMQAYTRIPAVRPSGYICLCMCARTYAHAGTLARPDTL